MKTLVPIKKGKGINNEFIRALSSLFTVLNTVRSNVLYIHWHATGSKFEEIHELTEKYYHILIEEYDYVAELNLQYGLSVGNPLTEYLHGMEETKESYDYANAIPAIKLNISKYTDVLKDACNQLESLHLEHSRIDEMISYWEKELNYKLDRML